MIYTITFNPAIDYVIKISNLNLGEINKIDTDNKYPGGKGINVSRVLNRFHIKNTALGFIGGFTGEYIKSFLENEGVETDFIKVKGDTRINIKLKSQQETELNGSGPQIEEKDLERLFSKLQNVSQEDFIVLAGNVQNSLPRDIYSQIQLRCKTANFIVDTTGEALLCTLPNKPFLIKPNLNELGELFGVKIKSEAEAILYGKKLLQMGAQNVIISMAASGALLICCDGTYHASVPKGTIKNSVGAGDSLIGGFLARYSLAKNIQEALRWGAAAGSATAFSVDLCTMEEAEPLAPMVKISKW